MLLFLGIARHYARWTEQVRLTDLHADVPQRREQVVIVPVSDLNKVTLNALNYARSVATRVVAVHVTDDETEAAGLQSQWETYGEGTNLVILESPYRSLSAPLLSYIDLIQRRRPKRSHYGDGAGVRARTLVGAVSPLANRPAAQSGPALPRQYGGDQRSVPRPVMLPTVCRAPR